MPFVALTLVFHTVLQEDVFEDISPCPDFSAIIGTDWNDTWGDFTEEPVV